MDRTEFLTALDREGLSFASACERAGLRAPVPACPEWAIIDLLWHLTLVHHFWRSMTAGLLPSYETYVPLDRPADSELLAVYRSGVTDTVRVLADADPSAEMWTWSSDRTPAFVIRRLAHETVVHRWDADQAAGQPDPIEAVLASDGIDEFLQYFNNETAPDAAPVGGSVHLHCTDVAGEWTARESADGFVTTREHAKGDCALRGAASDLLLVVWRRLPISTVDVVGDAGVATRFVAHSGTT